MTFKHGSAFSASVLNKFISVYRSLCYFLKEAMHIYDKTLVAVKKENEILGVQTS